MFKQESDPHYYCPFQDPDRKDADPQRLRAVDPDSHSFTLLDPDPGGENLRKKTEQCKEIGRNCNFIMKY